MHKTSKGVLAESSFKCSTTKIPPAPRLKPLDSERVFTDTGGCQKLLLCIFWAPQDFASSLVPLPLLHVGSLCCARLCGSRRDRRRQRRRTGDFAESLGSTRDCAEVLVWRCNEWLELPSTGQGGQGKSSSFVDGVKTKPTPKQTNKNPRNFRPGWESPEGAPN